MSEITKAVLQEYLERDAGIQYLGRIQIGAEIRLYYRTQIQVEPNAWKIVYVVE